MDPAISVNNPLSSGINAASFRFLIFCIWLFHLFRWSTSKPLWIVVTQAYKRFSRLLQTISTVFEAKMGLSHLNWWNISDWRRLIQSNFDSYSKTSTNDGHLAGDMLSLEWRMQATMGSTCGSSFALKVWEFLKVTERSFGWHRLWSPWVVVRMRNFSSHTFKSSFRMSKCCSV